jgi:gliding motility-associated protein GldC
MKKSEIKFTVTLDENKLPVAIDWEANDAGDTMRIDLWTKDMLVDEMKVFFHQTLLSMADTLKRATGEDKIAEDLKDYCAHFADKMNLLNKN